MNPGIICIGPDGPGEMQMHLDRLMLASTQEDRRTRIRLYRFNPPAVSLGYNQKIIEIDSEKSKSFGYDVVRRPTGGRAVLHKGDLVYSISVAEDNVVEDAPLHVGVYNLVSYALINGIRKAGINAGETEGIKSPQGRNGDIPRLCFSSATRHEVQVEGRKVVGSAQRRGQNAILQHGSILISDDHLDLSDLLIGIDVERSEKIKTFLKKRTISLSEAGYTGTCEDLAEVLAIEFAQVFSPVEKVDNDTFKESLLKEKLVII
ncbi:MAG: biotin/lipoate A/B protein ligase family protein [Candidatus Electryonea clarkiae]|nr:biotin/lipoate A/B protein ligase family protein [Candidatus Electryonea clarkiae]MDP8287938.1 biotin/lipoate A/B protein ligase family protein [Candidatus Electryonea clarkiae]